MSGKPSKEVNERCMVRLKKLLDMEENKTCSDCSTKVSINIFWVVVCIVLFFFFALDLDFFFFFSFFFFSL